MGTPIIKGKDVIGAFKSMRSSGLGKTATLTQSERKVIMGNSKIGRRIVANPNTTVTQSQFRQALKDVQKSMQDSGASQTPFSTWKSTSQTARTTLKQLTEQQAEKHSSSVDSEGKSEWEQKLDEKKEEAERTVLSIEAEGKEEAAVRREVAKKGQTYARQQTIEETRKEREKDIAAEEKKLADEDPKKLASHAMDLSI